MCLDCPGNYLHKFLVSLITVCSVFYIAKQGWRVRNEETFQRSSAKALKMLPPPQNPSQYSSTCIPFLNISLGSQRFAESGQKPRHFYHKIKAAFCFSPYPLADHYRHGYAPSQNCEKLRKLLPCGGLKSFEFNPAHITCESAQSNSPYVGVYHNPVTASSSGPSYRTLVRVRNASDW